MSLEIRIARLCVLAAVAGAAGSGLPAMAQSSSAQSSTGETTAGEPTSPNPTSSNGGASATTFAQTPAARPEATGGGLPIPAATAAAAAALNAPLAVENSTVASPPPFVVDVAAALARVPGKAAIDRRDRDGLTAFYEARQGRPLWMSARGATPEAIKLAEEIAKADDWGLKASDFDLPPLPQAKNDATEAGADALADAEVRLSLATLKYARHARGGRVEPTALTAFLDRKAPLYEPRSVLEQIATAAAPDAYLRKLHPQHPEFERLRQRYLTVRHSNEKPKGRGPTEAEQLLANMEQWRWMPADLGSFYVWVNVPEQLVRVVRDGRVIHTERVVIGKVDSQTPIFSDEMKQVIFHPFWGVPDSIKTNEVLPSLQRNGTLLAKNNLRIQLGGKDIDPATYDWTRTDIRRFHVYQPPGSGNVLGVVKFRFPNKHDVYMHDTPSKSLFKSSVRAFSHGCMRVQNPVRLAELILAEDRGMSPGQVKALTARDAPENNQINLSRHVPVHITYFTVRAEEDGTIKTFKDIYGHEQRVLLGLAGKMNQIKPVVQPKAVPPGPVGRLVEASPSFGGFGDFGGSSGGSTSRPDWARRVFSGSGGFSAGN